ncbi:hypothetical protein WUBG_10179, partial [Wuchereria bancrofti]
MRNVDEDLQQSSNLRVKETNALDDGINKRSSFRVKGFHLRGPPGVSEPKIASHNGTKYKPEIITENVEASGVVMTEIHEENSTDSASKPIVRKEVAELKVKKKSTGSDVALKENKKDNGKNIKGNFFSSFWRGNKSDEHQKRQKMSERNVHETEVTPVEVTSTTELEYNIPRTKIMAGSIKSSSDISHVEQQARQEDSVPVYDFDITRVEQQARQEDSVPVYDFDITRVEPSAEAELHYLENAKKLSMYGVQLFHAKDGKNTPVQIGISAHGINIYLDQIRVHRFLWQNIIKIGYRRNIFIIKVKPGELEKNESTIAFKLPDYEAAKRVWKCGVEHHTFFRLIQPEEKPHRGLFRWGSARFRYQGRTQFQSKMASQMFCNSQPIQRSQSVRVTQNDEN